MRSKALEKSRKQYADDYRVCNISRRKKVVDVPFRQPNWLGSIFSFTSSISQDITKSSNTLDKHDVNDIGLVSASAIGLHVLGIGTMFDSFQLLGTTPEARDVLKIMVIGSAST